MPAEALNSESFTLMEVIVMLDEPVLVSTISWLSVWPKMTEPKRRLAGEAVNCWVAARAITESEVKAVTRMATDAKWTGKDLRLDWGSLIPIV